MKKHNTIETQEENDKLFIFINNDNLKSTNYLHYLNVNNPVSNKEKEIITEEFINRYGGIPYISDSAKKKLSTGISFLSLLAGFDRDILLIKQQKQKTDKQDRKKTIVNIQNIRDLIKEFIKQIGLHPIYLMNIIDGYYFISLKFPEEKDLSFLTKKKNLFTMKELKEILPKEVLDKIVSDVTGYYKELLKSSSKIPMIQYFELWQNVMIPLLSNENFTKLFTKKAEETIKKCNQAKLNYLKNKMKEIYPNNNNEENILNLKKINALFKNTKIPVEIQEFAYIKIFINELIKFTKITDFEKLIEEKDEWINDIMKKINFDNLEKSENRIIKKANNFEDIVYCIWQLRKNVYQPDLRPKETLGSMIGGILNQTAEWKVLFEELTGKIGKPEIKYDTKFGLR